MEDRPTRAEANNDENPEVYYCEVHFCSHWHDPEDPCIAWEKDAVWMGRNGDVEKELLADQ